MKLYIIRPRNLHRINRGVFHGFSQLYQSGYSAFCPCRNILMLGWQTIDFKLNKPRCGIARRAESTARLAKACRMQRRHRLLLKPLHRKNAICQWQLLTTNLRTTLRTILISWTENKLLRSVPRLKHMERCGQSTKVSMTSFSAIRLGINQHMITSY